MAADLLGGVGHALTTGAGLFWKAAWALALGYAISAAIQVFVSPTEAADHLGGRRPRQLGLAMGLGFASSSCSFAALAATRSLFTKGASLSAALAFMFASTNLAIEVAALAFVFLGWQYALALFVGAPILVAVVTALVAVTRPERLGEDARRHASETEGHGMDPAEGLPEGVRERLRSPLAWQRTGRAYRDEWGMVWKDLLVGFTVAGVVAALVPASWFEALFPTDLPAPLLVPLQALMAPVLAVVTVIGSMGNGPLAAILAGNGVVFGAIMAFLYADFVVPPAVRINSAYYGRRFALYLAGIFAVSAVVTGIVVHALFALAGQVPSGGRDVEELATFGLDYTFVLNVIAIAVAVVLVWLSRRSVDEDEADDAEAEVAGDRAS